MNRSGMRPGALFSTLILSAVLAACGGTFFAKLSGTVTGLSGGTTVTLLNNGIDTLVVSANGPFAFGGTVAGGAPYNVTVSIQPPGEECTVTGGSGTVRNDNITGITVSCIATVSIGGTVGGTVAGLLNGAKVVLQNNGTDSVTVSGNSAFVFPTMVGNGKTYAVTVLTPPTGKSCTVSNGSGTIESVGGNISNVQVTCS